MGTYILGTEVTIFETFTVSGVPTNPTTVTFTVESPDDTQTDYVFGLDIEVTNPSVGYFELTFIPADPGTYDYRVEGTGAVTAASEGSFDVTPSALGVPPTLTAGPCEPWCDPQDVALCCSVETTDSSVFFDVAQQASQLLFELSGRLFTGGCGPKKVRPPCRGCTCGFQVTAGGYVIGPDVWGSLCDFCLVSCAPSLVKLSGYPIQAITEVKVDGAVLPTSEYRLHEHRYAMRLNDGFWPVRQDLTIPDTEAGTFSISYRYGQPPPQTGVDAAAQLACEIYKACNGLACALPTGVTRQVRQGLTIERVGFTSWAYQHGTRSQVAGWRTGLSLVDLFLSATNPHGHQRRPVFYGPGKRQYAQEWQ